MIRTIMQTVLFKTEVNIPHQLNLNKFGGGGILGLTKITLTIIKTNIFYLTNILTLFFLCYHYIHDMEATDTYPISEGCSFILNEGCVFVWLIEKPV